MILKKFSPRHNIQKFTNARKQAFKNHFFESVCTSKIRASRSKLAPKINSTLAKWKIEECVGKRDYETDR